MTDRYHLDIHSPRRLRPHMGRVIDFTACQEAKERADRELHGPVDCDPCNTKQWEANRRREALASGRVPPMYAAVVKVDQVYGGPQEGGWYHDVSEVLEVRRAYGFRSLLAVVRDLFSEYETCARGRSSVIGGSDVFVYLTHNEHQLEGLDNTREPWPTYE